ncbi:MAG: Lipoate-protein ligase A [Burkholderiaceae bacterium]|jgi:lipoate-protein ligase A|nr:MAG: Lipoate-protein ligase A [Burkholderiaceae bacterium]
MHFRLLEPDGAVADPIDAERSLLALAAQPIAQPPMAQLWTAPPSLVVPRSYRRHAGFEAARARFAAEGCPVHVRPSGGGLVPQGPGILNLSLAYTVPGLLGDWSEPIYRHLCELLQRPLAALGIDTRWQTVSGSFCDGRFNLAWGDGAAARKIAGTAQYWRPLPADGTAPRRHAVLAHAVLLVDADLGAVTARANAFEQAIASGRHYDAARTVSVAEALQPRIVPRLIDELRQRLAKAITQASPPVRDQAPRA